MLAVSEAAAGTCVCKGSCFTCASGCPTAMTFTCGHKRTYVTSLTPVDTKEPMLHHLHPWTQKNLCQITYTCGYKRTYVTSLTPVDTKEPHVTWLVQIYWCIKIDSKLHGPFGGHALSQNQTHTVAVLITCWPSCCVLGNSAADCYSVLHLQLVGWQNNKMI